MLDINAAINDAIAKAVESHIGAIHAQYSSTLGRLQERLDLFEDKVYGRLSDIESRALNSIDVLAERVKDNHRVTEGSLRDLSLSLGRTENEVKCLDMATGARLSNAELNLAQLKGKVLECIQNEIDDYFDSQRGEHRINDAISACLGDEYLKKCDFSEQLQECLDHEITLKVTVE
jgi:hypothetical protein